MIGSMSRSINARKNDSGIARSNDPMTVNHDTPIALSAGSHFSTSFVL